MSAARLAARCVQLLGPASGPVALVAPAARRFATAVGAHVGVAAGTGSVDAAIVSFVGAPADLVARQYALHALALRLGRAARLVLVDHNQPRQLWRRPAAALRLAAHGLRPARARYPAARELAALEFQVDRLELACGERIQLVVAHRR